MYLLLGLAVVVFLASSIVLYFKMSLTWIVLFIGLSALALGVVTAIYPRIRTRARFGGRPSLSDQEIYDHFYSMSGLPQTLVLRNWRSVASALGVPSGRLRPQDRLDTELAPQPNWQMHDETLSDILISVDARLTAAGETPRASQFTTLDDIVRCLVALDQKTMLLRRDR